jgi:hypothetical protein
MARSEPIFNSFFDDRGKGPAQICFAHRLIKSIGIGTRKPVAASTQQTVAGAGIALETPGLHKVVQPKQDREVDLPWGVLPGGQTVLPAA